MTELPELICGPLLRAVDKHQVSLWLVCSEDFEITADLTVAVNNVDTQRTRIGQSAVIVCLTINMAEPLTDGQQVNYDVHINSKPLRETAPHLLYPDQQQLSFVYKASVDKLLHGSCRRPHHHAADGLLRIDEHIKDTLQTPSDRAALVMHSGDQVYVDDVAGPMLQAIQGVIDALGLYQEELVGSDFESSAKLRESSDNFYGRDKLLPDTKMNEAITEKFFGGVRKPIFTSSNASNHLISLSEMLAMYLLVWSPTPWKLTDMSAPAQLDAAFKDQYQREQQELIRFIEGLPQAARALAHIPNYMIFDDHDVTDDWNLSALWEITAYEHPFSRRIVGNALIAYLLCQGWGNHQAAVSELLEHWQSVGVSNGVYDTSGQDDFITTLLQFDQWQYEIDRQPMILVLDTRTRRWRSERARSKPSGLMDWEALTEFQYKLLKQPSAIIISPAPMFGVKLIEAIQEVFTFFGKPLLVDAENWMAHQGAAEVMLNIFAHRNTPSNFTILSGDVHYSFVYDVHLKQHEKGPNIWQITSSGIKNEFPDKLLEWLDKLNRWLYAPYSPLNWFTKRRRFRITPRRPSLRDAGERVWNGSGIGYVEFSDDGQPRVIKQLNASGGECLFDENAPASPHKRSESLE